jgi:hypothetical protein
MGVARDWAAVRATKLPAQSPIKFSTMTLASEKVRQKRDECLQFAL